jgi:hypothetical protein
MCERNQLTPDAMETAMTDLATAPSTSIDEGPGEIEDSIMLTPTVDAARVIIAKLDERPNVA